MTNILKGSFNNLGSTDADSVEKMVDLILDKNTPSDTSAYTMMQVMHCPEELEQVNNLLKGGTRNRRWGAMVSMAVVPHIDTHPKGSITLPQSPTVFIDADSLDDLKKRLYYEVDKALAIAKAASEKPDMFVEVQKAVMAELGSK